MDCHGPCTSFFLGHFKLIDWLIVITDSDTFCSVCSNSA